MASDGTCHPYHDWFTATLTSFLCCGLVISYLPQHFRIVHKGSSEGFSPWFLLLGSTSSAAGMLNMITMQWEIVKCCRVVTVGSCVEMTAGVVQVGLQWLLFTIVLVLYIIYYPPHLKYLSLDIAAEDVDVDTHDSHASARLLGHSPHAVVRTKIKTDEWRLSITLAWVVVAHMFIISLMTFILLSSPPSPSPGTTTTLISHWATFLGLSSALLAIIQYAPQLVHTYGLGLVGALSIPMMCMQTPGAVGMVLSIALRPGTNWTSWITFAVSGVMQGSLLAMCIVWKLRQRRLGVDDFGHPLSPPHDSSVTDTTDVAFARVDADGLGGGEETPLLGRSKKATRRRWRGWVVGFRR